jgi:hypothetical protein
MGFHARPVAFAEASARARRKVFDGPRALRLEIGRGEVGADPRLPQALAGAVAQGGRGLGAHAQDRGELGRLHAFDLAVPQRLLPPRWQRAERLGRQRPVECDQRVVLLHRQGLEFLGAEGDGILAGSPPRGGDVAHRGEQVGTEGVLGSVARLQRLKDAHVRLGHEVVGLVAARHGAGDGRGGRRVPVEQQRIGIHVAGPRHPQQLGIAGPFETARGAVRCHSLVAFARSHDGREDGRSTRFWGAVPARAIRPVARSSLRNRPRRRAEKSPKVARHDPCRGASLKVKRTTVASHSASTRRTWLRPEHRSGCRANCGGFRSVALGRCRR